MRGMNKSVFLASLAMAASYVANRSGQMATGEAKQLVDRAYLNHMSLLTANGNTVKEAAKQRGRGPNGEIIYVPSRKWVDRSNQGRPHQGERECARRVRQMAKAAG